MNVKSAAHPSIRHLAILLPAVSLLFGALNGATFSAQIVDGLNRPVAAVQAYMDCGSSDDAPTYGAQSDSDGRLTIAYPDAADCNFVFVSKEGYETFSTGKRPIHVLRRLAGDGEAQRLASLSGTEQFAALREFLATDKAISTEIREVVLKNDDAFRPLLRTLAIDPYVAHPARYLLALLAVPEDVRFMVSLPSPPDFEGRG